MVRFVFQLKCIRWDMQRQEGEEKSLSLGSVGKIQSRKNEEEEDNVGFSWVKWFVGPISSKTSKA